MNLVLHNYVRSTAAYRVRIALNYKDIAAVVSDVDLLKGEQTQAQYTDKNPQGLVPALETPQGVLAQSLAIIEWLDEAYPETPKLLPGDAWQRAQIRSLSYAIACDMHPLNNLRVLKYLTGQLGQPEPVKTQWYHHWLAQGFQKIESTLSESHYCIGETLTMADLCLIPQLFNARRFEFDLTPYPKITAIEKHCLGLTCFKNAKPA
ncbi:maleylacetoacetate isomerase [Reinekea marina]|uniref:Maleylacetoacetate isomerase n=1 Tax=Reinekea marina TaxID=1310421 RepID=A0ABV7WRM6_9GAMM|nr:maleylacetoacetate isomerase [Reinekea marina]MDN3650840.1 maleylacetoacetate isomerase [Reinekea marina]